MARTCACGKSRRGRTVGSRIPGPTARNTVRVHIPIGNIFSPEAVQALLEAARNRSRP
jgi:hypothetical protein